VVLGRFGSTVICHFLAQASGSHRRR
jgi:hypothetical protein